jgi:hypothetical protein
MSAWEPWKALALAFLAGVTLTLAMIALLIFLGIHK